MFNALSFVRRPASALVGAVCIALASLAPTASADVIDVSLNVFYNNPGDIASGGTWQVVAKSDGFGLSGLKVLLTGVSTALLDAPNGTVNGSDAAGFGVFAKPFNPLGFHDITIGQAPLPDGQTPPREQSVFYGVGTLTNGAPNYSGKPPGANSIGPLFTTLTNVQDVPWATGDMFGDPLWNTAAKLTSGTFAPGAAPGFYQNDSVRSRGNIFTSLGSSMNSGNVASLIPANTIVRTNFNTMLFPDYNDNGVVDAADYVVWRNTLGQMGAALPADGNSNGMIDAGDYTVWRAHFGEVGAPAAGAGAGLSNSSVPEPACAGLLAVGAALVWPARGTRRWPARRRVGKP